MAHYQKVGVTFSLDTNAYADGDLVADTQALALAARKNGEFTTLETIVLVDKDDQKAAVTLVFVEDDTSLGTENAAPTISDANAVKIIGHVKVVAGDYVDVGGASVAVVRNIKLKMKTLPTSRTIYVGIISNGTPTYSAAGLVGSFIFDRN